MAELSQHDALHWGKIDLSEKKKNFPLKCLDESIVTTGTACDGIHELGSACIRGIPADRGGEISFLADDRSSLDRLVESESEDKNDNIDERMMHSTFR